MSTQIENDGIAGAGADNNQEQPIRAFTGFSSEEAAALEALLKADYQLQDEETENGLGYVIDDKLNGSAIRFSPNARLILETRYLEKDERGRVCETALDLFARVAVNIAMADRKYDPEADVETVARDFLSIMLNKNFMPNTPTLCNAGRPLQQLSACFVLPVEDYMATDDLGDNDEEQGMGIYDAIRYAAMIHKSGGGTGYNFSHLRPKNDRIATTFGSSSGPISFLRTFNASTEAVNQGGFRRGANMGIMEYWHPDIFRFVQAKRDGSLHNFNLSVGIDDAFMRKVLEGRDNEDREEGHFRLINPKHSDRIPEKERVYTIDNLPHISAAGHDDDGLSQEYINGFADSDPSLLYNVESNKVINRFTGQEVGFANGEGEILIHAGKLFDYVIDSAWSTGCPGIIFLDAINRDNPTPHVGKIEATNPCGEQPLLPFEACNLGAVNLAHCLKQTDGVCEVDFDRIEMLVNKGVHFLDNVIDMSKFPFQRIYDMVHGNRKIGLGMMGWADVLFNTGLPYGSREARDLAKKVAGFITAKAREASMGLAETRGVFANWEGSIFDPDSTHRQAEKAGLRVRNAAVTTIAPNGTTGMIADTSAGIEPVFSLYYEKICMDGKHLKYKEANFERALQEQGLLSEEVLAKVKENEGRAGGIEELPADMRELFKTSLEISPEEHVKMQAAFQSGIDNAVSKTVNLPHDATREDIAEVFIHAWRNKCKGITVFRDRSRDEQVLATRSTKPKIELMHAEVTAPEIIEVALRASKYTIRRARNKDTLHIIIRDKLYADDETRKAYFLPYEVFCERAPIGASQSVDFQMDGLDRSVILRADNPDYAEQIVRWKSPSSAEEEEGLGPRKIKSKHHAFGLVIEYHLLAAGVVAYNTIGGLYNVIQKRDLREVTDPEEHKAILSNGVEAAVHIEQNIAGNIQLGTVFECRDCGGTEYYFESGCHAPKCSHCGWSDGDCG